LPIMLISLLEFPTLEAAQGFAGDPDYAGYGQSRRNGSVSKFNIIDDTDVAGTIPYLAKGKVSVCRYIPACVMRTVAGGA